VLRYRLLGPLEVADEDRPITVPSAQQRLLLAMLLVEAGRTVHSGALIDALWGDRLPGDPSAALRTQVSRLRRRCVGTDTFSPRCMFNDRAMGVDHATRPVALS